MTPDHLEPAAGKFSACRIKTRGSREAADTFQAANPGHPCVGRGHQGEMLDSVTAGMDKLHPGSRDRPAYLEIVRAPRRLPPQSRAGAPSISSENSIRDRHFIENLLFL